jgi:hypothetical protein
MVWELHWSWIGSTTVWTVVFRLQGLDSPARSDGTELSGAFLLAQGLSLTLTGDYAGRLVRLRGD